MYLYYFNKKVDMIYVALQRILTIPEFLQESEMYFIMQILEFLVAFVTHSSQS